MGWLLEKATTLLHLDSLDKFRLSGFHETLEKFKSWKFHETLEKKTEEVVDGCEEIEKRGKWETVFDNGSQMEIDNCGWDWVWVVRFEGLGFGD
ncbi:hypothetical protein QYF36_025090 [Acer negundo]|nr:hypothetical protein QYF36_025090 [Acer negundo]